MKQVNRDCTKCKREKARRYAEASSASASLPQSIFQDHFSKYSLVRNRRGVKVNGMLEKTMS